MGTIGNGADAGRQARSASWSKMACPSPRNMILPQQETSAVRCALGIARRSHLSTDPWPRSDPVTACLYVTLSRGKGRDREGT